jgi:hypothetical protein
MDEAAAEKTTPEKDIPTLARSDSGAALLEKLKQRQSAMAQQVRVLPVVAHTNTTHAGHYNRAYRPSSSQNMCVSCIKSYSRLSPLFAITFIRNYVAHSLTLSPSSSSQSSPNGPRLDRRLRRNKA